MAGIAASLVFLFKQIVQWIYLCIIKQQTEGYFAVICNAQGIACLYLISGSYGKLAEPLVNADKTAAVRQLDNITVTVNNLLRIFCH